MVQRPDVAVLSSRCLHPVRRSGVYFIQEPSRAQLTELARPADGGHLRPQAGGVCPLAEAARACSAKAAVGISGSIILQP